LNNTNTEKHSEKSYDKQTIEAYYKIRSHIFDKSFVSKTPYMDWDGLESIDYNDILKLYYSYRFEDMMPRGGVRNFLQGKDLQNYIKFRKIRKYLPRILFLSFVVLVTVSYCWLNAIITPTSFYSTLVVLYLININLPAFVRRNLKKNRYIKL